MTEPERVPTVWLERALLLIVVGLVIQLLAAFHITPASFLLYAGGGVGLVVAGLLLLARAAILRRRAHAKERDAS